MRHQVDRYFAGYTYEGNDGKQYTGRAAFVLNHLDSAEAALEHELERMKGGAPLGEVNAAYTLQGALRHLLTHPEALADLI